MTAYRYWTLGESWGRKGDQRFVLHLTTIAIFILLGIILRDSSESITNLAGFLIVAYCFFAMFFLVYAPIKIKALNQIARKKMEEFERSLSHPVSEYECYSTGHPYTWTKIDYSDFSSTVESAGFCKALPFFSYPQVISARVDEGGKRLYLVTRDLSFDWDSLMHYDEWLKSKKEVSERIAAHKAACSS